MTKNPTQTGLNSKGFVIDSCRVGFILNSATYCPLDPIPQKLKDDCGSFRLLHSSWGHFLSLASTMTGGRQEIVYSVSLLNSIGKTNKENILQKENLSRRRAMNGW